MTLLSASRWGARAHTGVARILVVNAALATNAPPATGTNGVPPHDPYFIQNELERVNSPAVMNEVVSSLRARPGFAEHTRIPPEAPLEQAVRLLRRKLDMRQARATGVIEIRAYSAHPDTSAEIANRIAEVYMRTRNTNGIQVRMIERAVAPRRARRSARAVFR